MNYVHALRNALIPIITLLGLTLPAIVSGALITESVFNYPGMGLAFYNAASTTTSRSSSARSSSPPWRLSSGHFSPTSCTPSWTRGSAMCEPRTGSRRREPEEAPMIPLRGDAPDRDHPRRRSRGRGSPASRRGTPEVTEAGEAGGVGGLGRIIWRVFAENKLALVSVGVVVFMLLFCFVGPHIYVTNQTDLVVTSVNQVLRPPERPGPARHGPQRL